MVALLGRVILAIVPAFHDSEYFLPTLLACKVPFEKSADSLMETLLLVTNFFSLAAFKILYL